MRPRCARSARGCLAPARCARFDPPRASDSSTAFGPCGGSLRQLSLCPSNPAAIHSFRCQATIFNLSSAGALRCLHGGPLLPHGHRVAPLPRWLFLPCLHLRAHPLPGRHPLLRRRQGLLAPSTCTCLTATQACVACQTGSGAVRDRPVRPVSTARVVPPLPRVNLCRRVSVPSCPPPRPPRLRRPGRNGRRAGRVAARCHRRSGGFSQ